MPEQDKSSENTFDEAGFVQRHKTEAHSMFELVDHFVGRHDHYDLALDVGGGYGDHLPFIADRFNTIFAADVINYLNDNRFSPRDVARRSERFGGHMNLDRISFHQCDAQRMFYRDEIFDFVFSINAFEHIPNPLLALSEIIRVARKGSPVYIQFDPIWNSPWGHHLPHLNFEPWAHLLVGEQEFHSLIRKQGGTDVDISIFKTAMNRRPFSYYKRLFLEDFQYQFSKPSFVYWSLDPAEEPASQHENFNRCRDQGYEADELVVRGVQFFGLKA